MRRSRWEDIGRDEAFARPHAAQRVESVGERFAEDDDVGRDAKVFDRPELSGTIKAHLDLIVDHQNVPFVQDLPETFEIARRRDDVATSALNRFDVKR